MSEDMHMLHKTPLLLWLCVFLLCCALLLFIFSDTIEYISLDRDSLLCEISDFETPLLDVYVRLIAGISDFETPLLDVYVRLIAGISIGVS